MKTIEDLHQLDERGLIHEVLSLQERIRNLERDEASASQIHNYHFAGHEIIKLTKDRYIGSGVILSISSLRGEPLVKPVTICDGFSNDTINCLLDELNRTFNLKTELKPISKRLD